MNKSNISHYTTIIISVCLTLLLGFSSEKTNAQSKGYFSIEKGVAILPSLNNAPDSPKQGMMYFNLTDNKLYWYDGTKWIAIGNNGLDSFIPTANSVTVTGVTNLSQTVDGTYTYQDPLGTIEGSGGTSSIYQWYYATNAEGTNKTPISGASTKTYTISSPVTAGNYIALGVKPRSALGVTGTEKISAWSLVSNPTAEDGTAIVELVSSTGRIWMDRNLGAQQAATSSTDYLAYGSFYQWCRASDGHERVTWQNSTTGTPVNETTNTLSTSPNPGHSLFIKTGAYPGDWLSPQQPDGNLWWNGTTTGANNSCPTGYHVPTEMEWSAELAQGISNAATAYSKLKLTMAGDRLINVGSLSATGSNGFYWSSSTHGILARHIEFGINAAGMDNGYRSYGFSIRCIKNLDAPQAQSVAISGTTITETSVTGNYTYLPPQTTGSTEASSTFKWYYATDASGTGKTAISGATAKNYTIGAPVIAGNYLAFGVTPVSADGKTGNEVLSSWTQVVIGAPDGTAVVELVSTSGRVWMDRNLGAKQVATSSTDYQAYGSLFQWSRAADGHEKINWTGTTTSTTVNGTTATLSTSTNPGHSLFITNSNSPFDWLSSQQATGNLWWNGTSAGANNPCPANYHVPSITEWEIEFAQGITNITTAYNRLKLTMAGCRDHMTGNCMNSGSSGSGYYWSSTVSSTYAGGFYLSAGPFISASSRGYGFSVRCIKNLDAPQAQSVSINGTIATNSSATGNYTYAAPQTTGSAEGTSSFKWYYATDAAGTGKTAISGATAKNYTIGIPVIAGNYLAFGVTPVSADGKTGTEVMSSWFQVIAGAPDGTAIIELSSTTGRIWMDRNLGAKQVAASSTDYLAYGSLFQWCRAADGHEKINWTGTTTSTAVNGTTSTLSTSTTPQNSLFITCGTTPFDWLSSQQADGSLWWNGTSTGTNNPCPADYHVPSITEWETEFAQGITNPTTGHSRLRLTMAGCRDHMNGNRTSSGSTGGGYYWSSTANSTNAWGFFLSASPLTSTSSRGYGFSVRCIKNLDAPQAQSVTISGTTIIGSTPTGNYTYAPPQTTGSIEGTTSFKWYYATDAAGTGKTAISGATTKAYTIGTPVVAGNYLAFGVTPVSVDGKTGAEMLSSWLQVMNEPAADGTAVVELVSSTGRTWMDRNLGAQQAATSSTDYLAYGSLFQWCRAGDGHEKMIWTKSDTGTPVNGTTTTLASSSKSGHSLFIISTAAPYDWVNPQLADGSLWGSRTNAGGNNPCPQNYHVPTKAEWEAESIKNTSTAYSKLKLPMSGYRPSSGNVTSPGTTGCYWSTSTYNTYSYWLIFTSSSGYLDFTSRAYGFNVRCIKD